MQCIHPHTGPSNSISISIISHDQAVPRAARPQACAGLYLGAGGGKHSAGPWRAALLPVPVILHQSSSMADCQVQHVGRLACWLMLRADMLHCQPSRSNSVRCVYTGRLGLRHAAVITSQARQHPCTAQRPCLPLLTLLLMRSTAGGPNTDSAGSRLPPKPSDRRAAPPLSRPKSLLNLWATRWILLRLAAMLLQGRGGSTQGTGCQQAWGVEEILHGWHGSVQHQGVQLGMGCPASMHDWLWAQRQASTPLLPVHTGRSAHTDPMAGSILRSSVQATRQQQQATYSRSSLGESTDSGSPISCCRPSRGEPPSGSSAKLPLLAPALLARPGLGELSSSREGDPCCISTSCGGGQGGQGGEVVRRHADKQGGGIVQARARISSLSSAGDGYV